MTSTTSRLVKQFHWPVVNRLKHNIAVHRLQWNDFFQSKVSVTVIVWDTGTSTTARYCTSVIIRLHTILFQYTTIILRRKKANTWNQLSQFTPLIQLRHVSLSLGMPHDPYTWDCHGISRPSPILVFVPFPSHFLQIHKFCNSFIHS